MRLHGWYWNQSFIDGSNNCGAHRTHPWGSLTDHPPFCPSNLVVVLSYDISFSLILLRGHYGLDLMDDIKINLSSMGLIFGMWMGPNLGLPKWTIRVALYIMHLIILDRPFGWDLMADITIHPSSMCLILRVWIEPTLRVPKWTIRH